MKSEGGKNSRQSGKDSEVTIADLHKVEELEKYLREEKKQHYELSIKYDDMKADYGSVEGSESFILILVFSVRRFKCDRGACSGSAY